MSKYRVMLVDDEEDVRQAIVRKINWEQIGFEVVGTAENGQEGFEMAERLHPDVVMTDIKMPFMDGLTLARKLKEQQKNVKVIIFSGFDEFEYAKEAIKLEVEEYLLKPLNASELQAVFERIKENLDKEIDQKRNETKLNAYYQESLPIMREQLLIGLLEGSIPDEKIDQTLRSYEMHFKAEQYVVAVGNMEAAEDKEKEQLLYISLKQIIDENLANVIEYRSFVYLGKTVVIALLDTPERLSYFIYLMDQVCKISKRVLDVNTTIGIGNPCKKRSLLNISYAEAKNALDYRVLMEANQAIFIKDVEPKAETSQENFELNVADIIRGIKLGTREELDGAIHVFLKGLQKSKIPLSQYQIFLMELITEIYKLTRNYDTDMNEIFSPGTNIYQDLYQLDSPEALTVWMREICMKVRKAIKIERADSTKSLIDRAKQFVEEHYAENDLSVEVLCKELSVSPAYFSTLFKKETGVTFVAYLTEVRMNRAVELLRNSEEKTYVIAQKIGYAEPNYFSYVFKKQFGISPSKFRAEQSGKQ